MQVTLVGWLLIPVTLMALFLRPGWLYSLTIFLIPFSATSVVNLSVGAEPTGIPAVMFVGSALLLRHLLIAAMDCQNFKLPGNVWAFGAIGAFFIACLAVSLYVPIMADGVYSIRSPDLSDPATTVLGISWRNLTQLLYVCFWFATAWLIVIRNQKLPEIRRTLRIFALSAAFVCLWGILQWASFVLHFPYPAALFNSSASPFALGYTGRLTDLGVTRISSVAVEPSILAQYLLTVLPLLFAAVWYKRPLTSLFVDRIFLGLVLLVLFLSASATSYLGAAMLVLVLPWVMGFKKRAFLTYAFWLSITLFVAITMALAFPDFGAAIASQIVDKFGSYSVRERLYTIANAWTYFTESPWFGMGWGSVTSHDLVVNLLANSGILGLMGFGLLAGYPLLRLLHSLARCRRDGEDSSRCVWMRGVFLSLLVVLAVSAVGGFGYVFGYFWFVLAMAVAITLPVHGGIPSTSPEGRAPVRMGEPITVGSYS